MFPNRSDLFAAPFSDEPLYNEQYTKAAFWTTPDFYGVNLSALHDDALTFYYSQPVVGPVAPHTLMAPAVQKSFDFATCTLPEIQRFEIPLSFTMSAIAPVRDWRDRTRAASEHSTRLLRSRD